MKINWRTFTYAAIGGASIGLAVTDVTLYAAAVFHGISNNDTALLRYLIVFNAAAAAAWLSVAAANARGS